MSVLLTRYRCGHERQKLIECERARTRHLSHPCPTVVRTFVEPYGCLQAEQLEKIYALAARLPDRHPEKGRPRQEMKRQWGGSDYNRMSPEERQYRLAEAKERWQQQPIEAYCADPPLVGELAVNRRNIAPGQGNAAAYGGAERDA